MIALLRGELAYKSYDHLILDVGGVGYRLLIPLTTYYGLPEEGAVQLFVHTHVREDAIHLYGFLQPEEKDLFILLLTVSGVGPKLAVNILSHMAATDLKAALAGGDVKRLSALPGIGRKTAERLVLELRDKLPKGEAIPVSAPAAGIPSPVESPLEDALSALVNLGYKEAAARKALEALEVSTAASVEEVLTGALKLLAR